MATLNELGRNSASITYGPSSTGADQWPTLALVDQWVRNDTLQGYATTTGTSITGVSSIYTTQVRAGDVLMVAGAMRTVQSTPTSDSSITVTQAFTTATVLPSAVKVINTTLTGTVAATVRGSTTGVVAVTNGSATITGVGTYFLSECTNSVTLTSSLTGTAAVDTSGNITGVGTVFVSGGASNGIQIGDSVQIGSSYFVIASVVSDTTATVVVAPGSPITATTIAKATNGVVGRVININGRIRTITGISSNNSITVNLAMDFTDSGLKLKTYPRGTIAVSAGSATVAGTSTNFSWDLVSGDQVWVGDELRTFSFAANATTVATLTDYTGYTGTAIGVLRQAVTGINFKRDDTYITGTNTLFTSELRVGDELLIDGTEVTVSQILSNTSFRITSEFTHNMSVSVVYKKKKIHGYILEGTREGAATGGKFTTGTTSATAAGSGYLAGAYVLNVASATNFNQYGIIKIQGAGGPPRALTGQINTVSATTTVTGVNTLFTTELHVGAEIVIAGQYFTVTAIASDTSMTVNASMSVTGPTPLYRSIPLYTYIASVASTTITLGHAIRNTVYSNGANHH